MNNQSIPQKICKKCDQVFPATSEYFTPRPEAKDGLRGECRICYKKYHDTYYQDNREERKKKQREYATQNPEKVRASWKRLYDQPNYRQTYYEANRERRRENTRQWRKNNFEKHQAYVRKYSTENKEKLRMRAKRYAQQNPDKVLIYNHNRRARKRNLPNTFTINEWNGCLEYFDYTCAVCGCQLQDLFGKIISHKDHWVPISHPNCLGTIAENMVCLCQDCNQSKHNKLPEQWLKEKYGEQKAFEILDKVNQYFKSLV